MLRGSRYRAGSFAVAEPPLPIHAEILEGQRVAGYLGAVTLWTGEAPADASEEQLAETARAMAAHRFVSVPGDAPLLRCGKAVLQFGPWDPNDRGSHLRAVLAHCRGAIDDDDFRLRLFEMFLGHLKIRTILADQNDALARAATADRALRRLLDHAGQPAAFDVGKLLAVNDELTTHRAELAGTVTEAETLFRTLEINAQNFDAAWRESFFAVAPFARELIERWVAPRRAQAEADLGYRRARRDVAAVYSESVQASIDARQAEKTDRLALVMACLTAAQVAAIVPSMFKNFANWGIGPQLGLLGLVAAAIGSISIFLIQRR